MGQAAAGGGDRSAGVALIATGLAALALLAAPAAPAEPCRVIVNAANPATQIRREALVAIYLGQMTRWNDGKPIAAADQSVNSPVRAAFSEKILGKSVQSVQYLWLRKISSDHRAAPPPVKAGDAAVAAYVRANPGAIGYVSVAFALDDRLKGLKVVDETTSQGGDK